MAEFKYVPHTCSYNIYNMDSVKITRYTRHLLAQASDITSNDHYVNKLLNALNAINKHI